MGPFSTMPVPGGTALIAPSCGTVPKSAACGSMFQFGPSRACQIPLRSGRPSALRGVLEVGAGGGCGAVLLPEDAVPRCWADKAGARQRAIAQRAPTIIVLEFIWLLIRHLLLQRRASNGDRPRIVISRGQ